MKILFYSILFIFSGFTAFPQQFSWENMQGEGQAEERHENAFARSGDKFYLIGGRGEKPVDIYDTTNEIWSKGAQPPFEIHHMQAVNLDGLIYIISAFTGGWPNETPLTHVLVYDPVEDLWATGPKIPENRRRGAAGAVAYNDKIYLINGIINGHVSGWVDWLDEYDPYTNTWKKLPNSPRKRDHFHSAVINDKIYVAGGRKSGSVEDAGFAGTVKETDVFDLEEQTWESLADIPTERAGTAAVAFNEKFVVLGGESDEQEVSHDEVEAFDPQTNSWESLPAMEAGRHGTQAVVLNQQIIIGAGSGNRGGGPELNSFDVLTSEEEVTFEADSLVKGELSSSVEELAITSETAEVEIENSNGNTAILISAIQTDDPDNFQITTPRETPLILAPNDKITIKVSAQNKGGAAEAFLFIKSLGSNAPLEVLLKKEQ